MGQGAVRLVTQTINDLFFVVSVRGVQIPVESVAKGLLIGVGATLLAAAPPAWEAASVPPRAALSRSGLESKAFRAVILAALLGAALLFAGVTLLFIPTKSLVISFAATFAILVGIAMLAPAATHLLMRLAAPPLGRVWGSLGRMAPRDVINAISRTSIAIAALMVAISVSIGVSLMVGSFRATVIAWLDQTLSGDVYISAPSQTATSTSAPVLPEALAVLSSHPAVQTTLTLRAARVDSPNGMLQIAASSNPDVGQERSYVALLTPIEQIPQAMASGSVLISEPLANRLGMLNQEFFRRPSLLRDTISLYTGNGEQLFPVAGVYYDYASTTGTVLMSLETYRRYWQDASITAVALRLKPGQDSTLVARELRLDLAGVQNLLVRPNQDLRSEVLVVFDRTFAITGALQLLATIVAFIGILSTLLSLELEKQRELGILRSIGLTVRQMWGLVMLETGLMGMVAGLMALPTGYILAVILIYIINRRSFGWTLQMQAPPEPFLQALLLAIFAALLAGLYPAARMARMLVSDALRSE
jgi:putative ABC transport system permease protein